MENLLFEHNRDTCIGCCACQVACKDKNNLPPGEFFRKVKVQSSLEGKTYFVSVSCFHCEDAACIAACPNGAFYRAKDGTVRHDDGACIGCGRCVWSCPHGAVSLSRERGVAQKCTGCADLREKGREPACAAACVNRSLRVRDITGVLR